MIVLSELFQFTLKSCSRQAYHVEVVSVYSLRRQKCTDCHYGPALGTLKVIDGKKVPGLRGLSLRRAYLPDATTNLNAVIIRMPGGDIKGYDRTALADFLKIL